MSNTKSTTNRKNLNLIQAWYGAVKAPLVAATSAMQVAVELAYAAEDAAPIIVEGAKGIGRTLDTAVTAVNIGTYAMVRSGLSKKEREAFTYEKYKASHEERENALLKIMINDEEEEEEKEEKTSVEKEIEEEKNTLLSNLGEEDKKELLTLLKKMNKDIEENKNKKEEE